MAWFHSNLLFHLTQLNSKAKRRAELMETMYSHINISIFENVNVIGLHVRGGDACYTKWRPSCLTLKQMMENQVYRMAKKYKTTTIFLATDSQVYFIIFILIIN
jgi:hypothetical protein